MILLSYLFIICSFKMIGPTTQKERCYSYNLEWSSWSYLRFHFRGFLLKVPLLTYLVKPSIKSHDLLLKHFHQATHFLHLRLPLYFAQSNQYKILHEIFSHRTNQVGCDNFSNPQDGSSNFINLLPSQSPKRISRKSSIIFISGGF